MWCGGNILVYSFVSGKHRQILLNSIKRCGTMDSHNRHLHLGLPPYLNGCYGSSIHPREAAQCLRDCPQASRLVMFGFALDSHSSQHQHKSTINSEALFCLIWQCEFMASFYFYLQHYHHLGQLPENPCAIRKTFSACFTS